MTGKIKPCCNVRVIFAIREKIWLVVDGNLLLTFVTLTRETPPMSLI